MTRRPTLTFGRRYLFADLEQRSFELGTRADWTLSSRLSFQLYLQAIRGLGRLSRLSLARCRQNARFTRPTRCGVVLRAYLAGHTLAAGNENTSVFRVVGTPVS